MTRPTYLYVGDPSYGDRLRAELEQVFPGATVREHGQGLVQLQLPDAEAQRCVAIAYARQCLPQPEALSAPSVNAWAETLGELLVARAQDFAGPWRLHVFAHDDRGTSRPRRGTLIDEALLRWLRKKQRRLVREQNRATEAPWRDGEALAQLLLTSPAEGFFSWSDPAARAVVRRVQSRFVGGMVHIADDLGPPSRAHRKLREAEAHFGRRAEAGEVCVDLGAAPGGWTYVAVQRGATVIAVDRTELDPKLMRHPGVRFVRGDVFKYTPDTQVDWLLCDVIAFPEKTIALVERWLSERLCRFAIVTVKFRGAPEAGLLQHLKRRLDELCRDYVLRHLDANRNELTILAENRP